MFISPLEPVGSVMAADKCMMVARWLMSLLPSTIYRSFFAKRDHFDCKLVPEETKL